MSDIPGNSSTTANISIGGTYSGTIGSNSDRDWVRIDLDPGEWVRVSSVTSGSLDSFLTVYDADGNPITTDDYISSSNGFDAEVFFGGGEGGTFYVEVASYRGQSSGNYTLTARSVSEPSGTATEILDTGLARGDTNIDVYFVGLGETANFISNFFSPGDEDYVVSEGWTAYERERVEAALATIAAVTGLTFTITTDPNADFQLIKDTNEFPGAGNLAYFYLPGNASYTGDSAGVFNGNGFGWSTAGLADGGLGFSTLIHEFLHGLGLDHPHDDVTPLGVDDGFGDLGVNGINQEVYTIMSYNDGLLGTNATFTSGHAMSPMALDIAFLHQLYGPNMSHETGDTVYEMNGMNGFMGIWDAGGTDTIRYSGSSDVVIDLREANLTYGEGGGGYLSQVDGAAAGYTIAPNANIENADGGTGDDLLIGNDLANGLTGNGGDDVLIGGAGGDTLNGESGADTVEGTEGNNTIIGGSGFDTLTGGDDADTIFGGSGNDTIEGGGGGDTIDGGRGNDTIDGGTGNDTITGGFGQDTMTGGANADTFVFNSVLDSLAANADTITDFGNGADQIDLSALSSGSLSIVGSFSNSSGEVVLADDGVNTTVQIDLNGDGAAEMAIFVQGTTGLDAGDFIL